MFKNYNFTLKGMFYLLLQLLVLCMLVFVDYRMAEVVSNYYFRIAGLFFIVCGMGFSLYSVYYLGANLSPFPEAVKENKLLTTGPFKYIRHPIYTGLLIAAVGVSIYQVSLFKLLLSGTLYIVFYLKSQYEEQILTEKHTEAYIEYKAQTGRFVPRLRKNNYV